MAVDVELTRRRFTLDEYSADELDVVSSAQPPADRAPPRPHHPVAAEPTRYRLPDSEPEPDIVLLGYRDDFYRHALPGPDDVALLIEVANTSLRYDRHVKGPLYAEAGVRDYWIVDLEGEAVEVSRQPQAGRFHHNVRVARGDALSPLAFRDTPLAVADILG